MPTKRKRGAVWEYRVKRNSLLPRPVYLTFESEREGDAYVAKLEALLDRGIVPPDLSEGRKATKTIAEAIRLYLTKVSVPESDRSLLDVLLSRIGQAQLRHVNYQWVEDWVSAMKRDMALAPVTIRHYVGALGRCLDWFVRRGTGELPDNPIRALPRRYSAYSVADARALPSGTPEAPRDIERDRRLLDDEEGRIRAVLAGENLAGGQRPLDLKWQGALEALFDLALESGMRLREMYTLDIAQINLRKRTIFLDKTKNGDKRQVPLTSVAVNVISRYFDQVKQRTRRMEGFAMKDTRQGLVFPWWDGDPASLKKATALLSRQFARVFEAADCEDLTFHDLRHEATSRFFEKTQLSDLEIAKITGHKDLRMLSRYANLRGSNLATRLW